MTGPYTLGVDFGSESARTLLMDISSGVEVAVAERAYPHGVLDRALPSGIRLPPEWALQHPQDYLWAMTETVRQVLADSAVDPAQVIAIGTDFTSCTMLPVTGDGMPLCEVPGWEGEPHAWPKMWKHHAAQHQADRINDLTATADIPRLMRYGGKISSEWMFPKILQILDEAPRVAARADRIIEAQDWIVWQLCGQEVRSLAGAAYKAMHLPDAGGYPSDELLAQLHPGLPSLAHRTLGTQFLRPGEAAGTLSPQMAERLGLPAATVVASPNMDALASVAAAGVTAPGSMVMVMGTSTCDFVLSDDLVEVEGMCGAARDVVIPGLWAYEAGQNGVGDLFGWFVREALPPAHVDAAQQAGRSAFEHLELLAGAIPPGGHGLSAIDWWSGNRSVLVDAHLSGVIVGYTLATRPEDVYRALMEATAFGCRRIVQAFEDAGIPVESLVACGGLPRKSPLLMQLYADITGRPVSVSESRQLPARGAALHAAVAAGAEPGGYPSVAAAASALSSPAVHHYLPNMAHRAIYDAMYTDYLSLHDHFGRHNDLMRRLKSRRLTALQHTTERAVP